MALALAEAWVSVLGLASRLRSVTRVEDRRSVCFQEGFSPSRYYPIHYCLNHCLIHYYLSRCLPAHCCSIHRSHLYCQMNFLHCSRHCPGPRSCGCQRCRLYGLSRQRWRMRLFPGSPAEPARSTAYSWQRATCAAEQAGQSSPLEGVEELTPMAKTHSAPS